MSQASSTIHWPRLAAKNLIFWGAIFSVWFAIHQGYIRSDRLTPAAKKKITELTQHGQPVTLYKEEFDKDVLAASSTELGNWGLIEYTLPEEVKVKDGKLVLDLRRKDWEGAVFHFDGYEPGNVYSVSITVGQHQLPGFFAVRNRGAEQQIIGQRIQANNGKASNATLIFEAPSSRRDGIDIWFYPYEGKDGGGIMELHDFTLSKLVLPEEK